MSTTAPRAPHPLDEWPRRNYQGPQPWDHAGLGISSEDRDAVGSKRNTVTPVVSHAFPMLTSGSAHPCVHELGRKLGELGFPNSVSEGTNPFGAVDATVLVAVNTFRAQYGVQPDSRAYSGGGTQTPEMAASTHIDPWTAEGILRAHKREIQDAGI
jgi:hypothetical protein